MFLNLSNFSFFHWYNNCIYGVLTDGAVVEFNRVEAFLLELYQQGQSLESVRSNLVEIGLNENEISSLFNRFLQNNDSFLNAQATEFSPFRINGQKGQAFPLEIHIALTNKCFLKCKHCYKGDIRHPIELDYDRLISFLDNFRGKIPLVSVSGGEPTLYSRFNELVEYLSKDFSVSFSTSGFKISSHKRLALDYLGRNAQVSLYADNAEEHDAFTRIRGSFASTVSFIKESVESGHPISVTTLYQNDTKRLYKTIQYCSTLGVSSVAVGEILSLGRAKDIRFNTKDFTTVVDEARRDFNGIIPISDGETGQDVTTSCLRCVAGTLLWSIFEDGEIYGCGMGKIDFMRIGTIDEVPRELLRDNSNFLLQMQDGIKRQHLKYGVCPFKQTGVQIS